LPEIVAHYACSVAGDLSCSSPVFHGAHMASKVS
jgi:hypothetical protein